MFATKTKINQTIVGPVPPTADPYWDRVVTRLTFDSDNGQANNRYLDKSALDNTVTTLSGILNPGIGKFSPFANQSVWFNGTTDYLTVASAADLNLGLNDFTLEMWFSIDTVGGNITIGNTLITNADTGTNVNYFQLAYNSSNRLTFVARSSTVNTPITGTTTLKYGKWYHVALVRSAGTFYVYLDGVLEMSQSSTVSITQRGLVIGSFRFTGYLNYFPGFIYQVNLTSSVKYTDTFVPTPAYIEPDSNTILLILQGYKFEDQSPAPHTLARLGTPKWSTFLPDDSPTGDTGYSAMFNHTGVASYLTVTPPSGTFTLPTATTPWTLEAFIYPTAAPAGNGILNGSTASPSLPMCLSFNTNGSSTLICGRYSSGWVTAASTIAVPQFAWSHVAGTFDGTVLRVFVNGVLAGTSAATTCPTTGPVNFNIGRRWDTSYTSTFNGHIAYPRVTIGDALYTSTFTPPSGPLQPLPNTKLLMTFEDGVAMDNSNTNTISGQNASFVSGKFNTTGLSVNQSTTVALSSYGYFSGMPSDNIGRSDFTIEFWMRLNNPGTTSSGGCLLFDTRPFNTNGAYPAIGYSANNIFYLVGGSNVIASTNTPISTNWHHVAVSRTSGLTRLFVDGTQVGNTYTDNNKYLCAPVCFIGASAFNRSLATYVSSGVIDDFRFTRGYSRYPANFTPPTAPFYYG